MHSSQSSYTAKPCLDKQKIPIKTVWRDDYHADPYIEYLSREDRVKYRAFLRAAHYLDAFLFNGTLYKIEGEA